MRNLETIPKSLVPYSLAFWMSKGFTGLKLTINIPWTTKGAVFICHSPVGIYFLKVKNRNTTTICEIFSKLTIKTPERRHWRRSVIFIVNIEHFTNCSSVFIVSFEHGRDLVSLLFHLNHPLFARIKKTSHLTKSKIFKPL